MVQHQLDQIFWPSSYHYSRIHFNNISK